MAKLSSNVVFEKSVNLCVALVYGVFAYSLLRDWVATGRGSSLLFLIQESAIIVFFLIRAVPKRVSTLPYDWFVAVVTTALPLFMRAGPIVHDITPLLFLQFTAVAFCILGTLSLNRSFGIVPANRGVKKDGLYRCLRHPIYAGYSLAYATFALQNPTYPNIAIYVSFMIFVVLRIRAEERLLSQDPAYAAFMKETRWRLIPGVF